MNLLDMAAVAVPTAFTAEGRPFGITLGAAAFSDRLLLSIANRIQQQLALPLAASDNALPPLAMNAVAGWSWRCAVPIWMACP